MNYWWKKEVIAKNNELLDKIETYQWEETI